MKSLKLTIGLLFSVLTIVLFAVACDKSASDAGQQVGEEAQHHGDDHAHGDEHAQRKQNKAGEKEAGDIGTRHDPPISIAEVKDGHWMCDMGTVHYTRPEIGDDRCPLCGMRLTQKKADNEVAP